VTVPAGKYQLGVEGPPNPEDLTDHILLPEQGDTSPDKGLSVFYGIAHSLEDEPRQAYVDELPDGPGDIGGEVNRYARGDMSQPVKEQAANQTITYTYHLGTADPSIRLLARDDDRKLASVSMCADDFTTVGTFAVYLSSGPIQNIPQGIGGFQVSSGAIICTSANPASLLRPVSSKDELWAVLDPASSKSVYVSVYIERY
jgi:hypothetical protein